MDTNLLIGIGIVSILVIVLFVLVILVFFQVRKVRTRSDLLSESFQNTLDLLQRGETTTSVLVEKVSNLQENQNNIGQFLGKLDSDIGQAEKLITAEVGSFKQKSTESLLQMGSGLSSEISKVRGELSALQASSKARYDLEQQTSESIRRLEAVIAGTQTKGSAGENIVELIFSKLPIEWQVRNFTVNGKTVEFGLKFPNNLVLPIDSKWTATDQLEKLVNSEDPIEQQNLKSEIQKSVISKAKEVRKYIDPNITVTFGVAVIPDAVYEMCANIYPEIFRIGIVLVSYSMFVPYLLMVFHTILKSEQNIDFQKLYAYLQTAQNSLENIQDEINGRFSRALTMLSNSRDDLQAHVSSVNSSITGLQINTSKGSTPMLSADK